MTLAEQAIDHGDEQGIAGGANHLGNEALGTGIARERAAFQDADGQLVIAALIGPGAAPVRVLVGDEQHRVQQRNRADHDQRTSVSHGPFMIVHKPGPLRQREPR